MKSQILFHSAAASVVILFVLSGCGKFTLRMKRVCRAASRKPFKKIMILKYFFLV